MKVLREIASMILLSALVSLIRPESSPFFLFFLRSAVNAALCKESMACNDVEVLPFMNIIMNGNVVRDSPTIAISNVN